MDQTSPKCCYDPTNQRMELGVVSLSAKGLPVRYRTGTVESLPVRSRSVDRPSVLVSCRKSGLDN